MVVCAAAFAGCGQTTNDQIEMKVLTSLNKEPPPGVQETIFDIDCPGPSTAVPKDGAHLVCGAYNVDKPAHTPQEQIGSVMLTVGQEGDYKFRACTATPSGRGPKC